MSKLAENLRKPYESHRKALHRHVTEARRRREHAAPYAEAWPDLETHTREQVFTCLNEKNDAMNQSMASVPLKDLHRQEKRMKKLINISWFNTWALKVRFLNFCYRLAILTYYAILFAVAVGVIYLIVILLRAMNL